MKNSINQAEGMTLAELREFVDSEECERDNAIWVKNIFDFNNEKRYIMIRAVLDVKYDGEIVAVWNYDPQQAECFSEKTYGEDWIAYLVNPDDKTVKAKENDGNKTEWVEIPKQTYPRDYWDPCANCEVRNKPYWSIISPCQGCIYNHFANTPSITYTSTTATTETHGPFTDSTVSYPPMREREKK